MNNSEVIVILDRLVVACEKGRDGFRDAAVSAQNSEFRRLFNIFSQQRIQFISELKSEINRLRGDVSTAPEGATELPSNTLPFRRTTARKPAAREEVAIITECQREEEAAVTDYQDALKADLPLDVQYVVKRQYVDIKDAYDRIRILQRAA